MLIGYGKDTWSSLEREREVRSELVDDTINNHGRENQEICVEDCWRGVVYPERIVFPKQSSWEVHSTLLRTVGVFGVMLGAVVGEQRDCHPTGSWFPRVPRLRQSGARSRGSLPETRESTTNVG